MTTLVLTVGVAAVLGFVSEAAVLFSLIVILIAHEIVQARPVEEQASPGRRTFHIRTLPLVLIVLVMTLTRIALP